MVSRSARDRARVETANQLDYGIPVAPTPADPVPASVYSTAIHAMLDNFARANGAVDAIRGAE